MEVMLIGMVTPPLVKGYVYLNVLCFLLDSPIPPPNSVYKHALATCTETSPLENAFLSVHQLTLLIYQQNSANLIVPVDILEMILQL
jgi:hypothetical protein